jgi:hypothetical protein
LNYIAKIGSKPNTLQTTENNPTVLLHARFGFTYNYLTQFWHRVCCTGCSPGAEAPTILLSAPLAKNDNKKGPKSKTTSAFSEDDLARSITQGLFVLLRLQEGVHDFNIDDPVPKGDAVFDKTNDGILTIFNASSDDPLFVNKTKFDVVTDGNTQVNRKLEDKEKKYAKKNLPCRPRKKKRIKAHLGKQPTSRCKTVSKTERIKIREDTDRWVVCDDEHEKSSTWCKLQTKCREGRSKRNSSLGRDDQWRQTAYKNSV